MKGMFYFDLFLSGEPLIHNISTAYTDLTYLPRLNDLPSAREVSSLLFRQNFANTTGHETRNALFAFFGKFLMFNPIFYQVSVMYLKRATLHLNIGPPRYQSR